MADRPKPLAQLDIIREAFSGRPAEVESLTAFDAATDSIPHAELADQLRTINRRFDRFPLKQRAFSLYTNNRIHLLGNKETVKVVAFIPGWRVAGPRGVQAFVNAVPHLPSGGADRMDPRVLFGLLLCGEVLVDTYESWGTITASTALGKAGAAVYSRMFFKVIDRISGAGADRMRSDQLKYVLAKYFLLNLMGWRPGEAADAVAMAQTKGTTLPALESFEGDVAQAAGVPDQAGLYSKGILDFVGALAASSNWLGRLTRRGFLQATQAMYGSASMLAAEDLGYFMCALVGHQAGSELVQSYAFEPVFQPEGTDAIAEFARAVGA